MSNFKTVVSTVLILKLSLLSSYQALMSIDMFIFILRRLLFLKFSYGGDKG